MMRRRSIGKPTLLAGCALGVWLALAPSAATAQAFQGTGTVAAGSATITTGAGSTSVLVGAEETVINWTPFNMAGTGTIDFMPAGTVALFRGGSETFTVLNRVIPVNGNGFPTARTISLNGTITSLRQDPVTLGRGNVWFYSPTGIIVGPTAIMNVGSLILTTNDIGFVPNNPNTGTGGSIYLPGGRIEFRGATDSTGLVEVQNGAQLNALGVNAYLALVAPRVIQRGTVTADGQVAYIAAEAVDMTISAGLFDFTVVTGTTDENGVVHTGTTTGPASTDRFADPQRIAMVAVPKNDAITMLLSGSIGYTPAASASNEGSSIVLTAGFETPEPFTFNGFGNSSIQIGPGTFRNPLTAWATDRINVLPQGGTTRFGGRTFLNAGGTVEIDVIEREFVIGDSDLILRAGRPGTGGTVDLFARTFDGIAGGVIDVAGTLSADASSYGILSIVEPPLDGQGGDVIIDANGGTISANFLSAVSDGYGLSDSAQGGMGTGGTIDVVARSFGTIEAQTVDLFASGHGGYSSGGDGGDGLGGAITLRDAGGTLAFGSVFLGAHGTGGDGGGLAGNGTSGTAGVSITGQAQAWSYLGILANAFPGRRAGESLGQTGSATGQANAASLAISGDGALTLTAGLNLTANALMYVSGQPGFTGQGGGVDLSVTAGGDLTVTGGIFADASTLFGGEGIFFDPDSTPTMQGGQVSVTADGGTITAFELSARANASGFHGSAAAGAATGGTVTVSALNGGRILLDDDSGTSLLALNANGLGTPGTFASNAFGGTAQLIAEDGSITVLGDIEVSASGQIGQFFETPPDGPGHNATGGTATVELRAGTSGTATIEADDLTINAVGDSRLILAVGTFGPGGQPIRGDGGAGTGGTAGLTIAAGTLTVGDLTLDSSGTGGGSAVRSSGTPWVSGNGFGGTSQFAFDGGIANIVALDILSNGIGGDGTGGPAAEGPELPAIAGEGTGGLASLSLSGTGMLRVTDTLLEANGLGAPGMDHIDDRDASDGGTGSGGSAGLSSAAGWAGSFSSQTLALRANGEGGDGGFSDPGSAVPPLGSSGEGGSGFGGTATVVLSDGTFSLGPVEIQAIGNGGDSGDASGTGPGAQGGQGSGGTGVFSLIDSPAGPAGARTMAGLSIDTSGNGGFGPGGVPSFSEDGDLFVTVDVLDAGAALEIAGDLVLSNTGGPGGPGTGIELSVAGAPLTIGGQTLMSASEDILVDADEALYGLQSVQIAGHSVQSTGLIRADGFLFVGGSASIQSENLSAGQTTTLFSFGPITVGNLTSAGQVSATGGSIEIRSNGGLDFVLAEATGGDLFIETAGDLDVTSLSATGSVALASSGGQITTGNFTAGTWIYVDAFGAATLGNITAGIDAAVTTRNGNLTIGNVTAGDEIWLSVFGTDATRLLTAGNLVSTGLGADDAPGPTTVFGAYPNGAGPVGNVTRVRSSGSLIVGDMQSAGRAILVADAGTTTAGDLSADEALIVLGRGDIALDSIATEGRFYVADSAMFLPHLPDAYDPASLDGVTPVRTGGGLTIGGAVQAGDISVAVAGTATAPSWTSAGRLFIDSGGLFTSNVLVSAGGNASITADSGIDLTALTVGGTTILRSPLGAVEVGNLLSTGAVTARGRSVDIASGGALSFADLDATAGNLVVATTGNLGLVTADATGTTTLSSSTGSITATGAVVSGGAVSATGPAGVSFASLSSGGTTLLQASGGAVDVDQLTSTGAVTARGRSVDIRSTGALTFADLDATAGNLLVQTAGSLALTTADATGTTTLSSASGSVAATGAVNSGGAVSVMAETGVTFPSLASGGTTLLESRNGNLQITQLTSVGAVDASGRNVDIASGGALTFADLDATAGNLAVATAGNLALATADATGNMTLSSSTGSITATGAVVSGGAVSASGPAGVSFASLTSGGTTLLRATGGAVDVDTLLSSGAVTALGRSLDIRSTGALTFADLDATAGNLLVATGGNLALATADATGTATLTSATGSIAATGAVNSGGAFSATAPAGLTFASLTSGGTTQLTSADGPIDVDSLVSPGLVSVSGRGVFLDGSGPLSFATAVSTGQMAITASGNLAFASVDSALDLTLTSTTGSITASGDVRGGFPNLTAAGNILIEGSLASLGTLVVDAGGSFTVEGDTGADDAQIAADQGITMTSLQSGEITRLTSTDGNIRVGNLQTGGAVYASGRNIDIDSTGSLRFIEAFATAGDVLIDADGLAIHETTATGMIDLDAGGLFTLLGTARGVSIDVISENIQLDAAARLGVRGTTRDVTLRNGDSESPTFIGGGPREGPYTLERTEAAQIFADESITILADGDITIDDLALSFGGGGRNIGAGGMLEISTPEEVHIIGDVALSTSGPDDTFRIDPSLIALDTATGSIAMTLLAGEGTTGGTPQGRLELVGDRIVAATGANITQLGTMTDLDAITALLAVPGGTGEPLSAGTIHIDATESLYIQNSGASAAFADRRGFVASGLEIATESNTTQIAINGRILTQGGAATGLEVAPLVSINGAPAAAGGQFHPRSTINGCVIGADCNPPPEPENPELDLPTSEDVDPIPAQSEGSLFVAPLIELAGTDPLITPPLVDEPITGVGNDDLWEPRCEPGEEDSPCPEDDGQP